ncbi:class I SAM-dependent methyltransferase [Pseudohalioglobus sediminis]|uniref:Class I SAM-dependent methyltransferase n=1 Tax=Pseudohalioglobus sediminis TaxID=2606449 RepID=A0A5B0WRM2_9GAMM|nr:class I SAM-dependent methyltransferase [Pseudohalioglobus sediminis]KAA1189526.1 class I SAM-dependent methyltransferase [Pseudohalioglobus sediminis]
MKPTLSALAVAALALVTGFGQAVAAEPDPALVQVVESRSEADRARDGDRHPVETLTFFQVKPGMTVAETLPGGGWYTRILANYLGSEGTLYGVNYVDRMWPMFSFATEEFIERQLKASAAFPGKVEEFTDNGISAKGFTFNTFPPEAAGTVDRVLMIRSLHNLNRFEASAGTRSQALAAVRAMLKEDGLVGVVQHRLPESQPEEGADGSRGYLKQSDVVAMFEAAGFELVASSEINANPKDQPGANDSVWRLPPSLRVDGDDPEQRAAMQAIGESDRMTLLFRKGA